VGYRIKPLPYKKRTWKVQIESYVGGKRKTSDLPETEYMRLGFRKDMSLEEAQARRDQLNAQEELKRIEVKRAVIAERQHIEDTTSCAFLPPADVSEFEQKELFARGQSPKKASHWRVARRLIRDLKLDPSEWSDSARHFYDWFYKRQDSPSHMQKVMRVLNDWGKFQGRKYKKYFEPVPLPTGNEKSRLWKAYYQKRERGLESDPISPEKLESVKSSLKKEHYNWLYLSVWFGLRGSEIDSIAEGKHFKIETTEGIPVLHVFQTKLSSLREEDQWKLIPCILPEQLKGIVIIKSGKFTRPGRKVFKSRFTDRTTTHGGRKNFTDMMLDKGYSLEDISSWLGHTTIERTWKSYKSKKKVRIPKRAA
jgi:hypothetical protein